MARSRPSRGCAPTGTSVSYAAVPGVLISSQYCNVQASSTETRTCYANLVMAAALAPVVLAAEPILDKALMIFLNPRRDALRLLTYTASSLFGLTI